MVFEVDFFFYTSLCLAGARSSLRKVTVGTQAALTSSFELNHYHVVMREFLPKKADAFIIYSHYCSLSKLIHNF